ncbi:CBS domain-containing protein [Paraburkholderia tropica]|uniref:CBS domain-containing protein n=1 Tax=Paraburkholderia tropica TaxID=92647 RepID=UPI00161A4B0E|nr:CBS domain-containing protein [Paraburkholderia tropica]MBB3002209.1 CBS domain-containing protein [Paraburkholderia tropica]MBB6321592.1 CBS domain-containing protein [Paraburkholderia tropica]
MRAMDVMTPNVVTVSPETSVRDAAKLLLERRISGAPVLDAQGQLVGIISEGDLLRRIEIGTDSTRRKRWLDFFATNADADAYVKSHARRVEDVMTTEIVSVNEEDSLTHIAALMERRGVKRVPVLRDGKLVGIVSRANLLQALASSAEEPQPVSPSDREIRERLVEELEGRPWAFAGRNVVVREGVVHLWGTFNSADAVRAVRVAAEGIPGVRAVEDHTEPYPIMPGI